LVFGNIWQFENGVFILIKIKKYDAQGTQIEEDNFWEFMEDNSLSQTVVYEDKRVDEEK